MEYNYKALDPSGKTIAGSMSAINEAEVVEFLRSKNHRPVSVAVNAEKAKELHLDSIGFLAQKVKAVHLTMFCKQLSTMLIAGIPLNRALDIQCAQTENKTLKTAVYNCSQQIKQGIALSRAMKQQPTVFPVLLINMVEAGEMTGQLDTVLSRMYVHYDKENKINNKIKGAMVYPMVLGFLTVVLIIGMLTFVLPTFTGLFEGSGGELPGLTQGLIDLSDILRNYWYIILGVVIGIVAALRTIMKTRDGKMFFDGLKLKLPVIKKPMAQIITSRFTRTLSTLLTSGISIIKALESATEITNNLVVIEAMDTVISDVKKGTALSSLLRKVPVFPTMMVSMVSIGEETGAIDDLLAKTADYYDEELEVAMSRLVALLEPIMILVMGVSIGFIVVAMLLPMFSMFEHVA